VYSFGKDLNGLSKNHAVAASRRCNTPIRAGVTPRYWTQPSGSQWWFRLCGIAWSFLEALRDRMLHGKAAD
jgi:hypothetical protein